MNDTWSSVAIYSVYGPLKYLFVLLQVWKLGWSPQPGGEYGTTLPEIPVDFLQEKDVFREFLYRINTLGVQIHTRVAKSA